MIDFYELHFWVEAQLVVEIWKGAEWAEVLKEKGGEALALHPVLEPLQSLPLRFHWEKQGEFLVYRPQTCRELEPGRIRFEQQKPPQQLTLFSLYTQRKNWERRLLSSPNEVTAPEGNEIRYIDDDPEYLEIIVPKHPLEGNSKDERELNQASGWAFQSKSLWLFDMLGGEFNGVPVALSPVQKSSSLSNKVESADPQS